MTARVVLVRHGRSSHEHIGWIDREAFLRWRDAYEAAGIRPDDTPPAQLRALADASAVIVASDARRAIESAAALAPDRAIETSTLLRELDLEPPHVRLRLPLIAWALLYGVRWIVRAVQRRPQLSDAEQARIRAAADWIEQLASTHGSVIAVTHASFRRQLAHELASRGFHIDAAPRASHWSAWTLSP